MRNTAADRARNMARIREAIEMLLNRDDHSGDSLNVKALADAAGITRSALYGIHYVHLKDEFLRRAQTAVNEPQQNREQEALHRRIKHLESRLRELTTAAEQFKQFRALALSRIAAQYEALLRSRAELKVLLGERPGPPLHLESAPVLPFRNLMSGQGDESPY